MGTFRVVPWLGTLVLTFLVVTALPASAARSGAYPGGAGAIAFVQSDSSTRGVWKMNPDGSAARRFVPPSVSSEPKRPAWSPDGRKLAFYDSFTRRLHVVNSDGSGHRVIAGEVSTKPSWSPNGTELAAVILVDGTPILTAMRAEGSGRRELVPRNPQLYSILGDFAWSSTGRLAVALRYESGPDRGKDLLVAMDPGGGNETVVFRPNGQCPGPVSPSWSPDGSRITFELRECVRGGFTINVVDANGSNRRILAVGREPAWSPDGTKIVYTAGNVARGGSDDRITVMNGDGSSKKELGRGGSADWQPCRAGASCRLAAPTPAPAPPRPPAPAPVSGKLQAILNDDGTVEIAAVIGRKSRYVQTIKPGVYNIYAYDASRRHNIHLVGVGINRRTVVAGVSDPTWKVRLRRGKLSVYSDRAPRLRSSITVS